MGAMRSYITPCLAPCDVRLKLGEMPDKPIKKAIEEAIKDEL